MRFSILFLIFISFLSPEFQAWGQETYRTDYFGKNIQLTQAQYRSQIVPLIRNILKTFDAMIGPMSLELGEIQGPKRLILAANKSGRQWVNYCLNSKEDLCVQKLRQTHKGLGDLERKVLEWQNSLYSFSRVHGDLDENFMANSIFADNLSDTTFAFLMQTELGMGAIASNRQDFELANPVIIRHYQDELEIIIEQMMLHALPSPLSTQLTLVWLDFIRPLEDQVEKTNNAQSFVKKIQDLNTQWNKFNSWITKGNIRPSSQVLKSVSEIQNYWNGIMRILL